MPELPESVTPPGDSHLAAAYLPQQRHAVSCVLPGQWGGVLCRLALSAIALLINSVSADTNPPQSAAPGVAAGDKPGSIRFNRDIRPILASHCFQCHGPDGNSLKGSLRLDKRESATAVADSGKPAIVSGQPGESLLIQRIHSSDPDLLMPPPETGKPLNEVQKQLLQDWIADGAAYEEHWAFIPISRPALPTADDNPWIRNEIDRLILIRLQDHQLQPSPSADPAILLRRLSLDLTGLPPAPEDVECFIRELSFTDGTETATTNSSAVAALRNPESEAAYQRWVNRLLESPHYGERMAVDWLDAARFADTNGYQVDRDREMYAWRDWVIQAFNSNMPFDQFTTEQIAGDLLPDSSMNQKIATGFHRNHMMNEEGGVIPEEFLAEYCADRVETTATVWLGQTFNCARCHDHKFDPFTQSDYYSLYSFFHNIAESGLGNYGASIRHSAPPVIRLPAPEIEQQMAALQKELEMSEPMLKALDTQLAADHDSWQTTLKQQIEATDGTAPAPQLSPDAAAVLAKVPGARSDADRKILLDLHRASNPDHQKLAERVAALPGLIKNLDMQIPTTLVMQELPEPRVTRILQRGAYDKPGEPVTANTPAALPPMATDLPRNRLGLARWLTDPANPLPARVTVNRLWQSLFGIGLVKTAEDFGTQGEPPSHPELLDWLADEFIRSGWDIKHMLRLMVTSSAYRQSSRRTPELQEIDPENRLLARGPRFRLHAEFIRDQALSASGLLIERIGGPSVKPYHPPGLYEQVTAGSGTDVYVAGTGDDLRRRSLYTYWKRSVPNPAMLTMDAPFREACTMRRPRTNTPLQALNLMNDPTYVEASRWLAERMLSEGGSSIEEKLSFGFRLVLSRQPRPDEHAILLRGYQRNLQDFRSDSSMANELLQTGSAPKSPVEDAPTLAAMTMVSSTILNLDEAVMKE